MLPVLWPTGWWQVLVDIAGLKTVIAGLSCVASCVASIVSYQRCHVKCVVSCILLLYVMAFCSPSIACFEFMTDHLFLIIDIL